MQYKNVANIKKLYRGKQNLPPQNLPYLDKLAQLGPGDLIKNEQTPAKSEVDASFKLLRKRQIKKYINAKILIPLINLHNIREKHYKLAYTCFNGIYQDGYTLKNAGYYCNSRVCLICNNIRTAKYINKYYDTLQEYQDLHFITLTVPAVNGDVLRDTIGDMYRKFTLIRYKIKRKDKLIGLRKLECNYNIEKNWYNPHYHLIVQGKHIAARIRDEWLRLYPNAVKSAQDIQEVEDEYTEFNEKSLLELFKYMTKLWVSKNGKINFYPAYAIDTIIEAMWGKRIFVAYGLGKQVSENVNTEEYKMVIDKYRNDIWEWSKDMVNWVSIQYGDTLLPYDSGAKVLKKYQNKIEILK